MKSIKYFLQFGIITFMASTILLQSCKKGEISNDKPITILKNYIAYVYKVDSSDAHAFKSLMEENDCHVKLIERSAVAKSNFTQYNLLVIDQNTDVESLKGTWTNEDTLALQKSGKPMILIGVGGLQYASKIANKVQYLQTGNFSDNKFYVSDKSSVLYKKPYIISVPTSTPAVTLYQSKVLAAGYVLSSGQSSPNVALLGSFTVATSYYPLTFEKNRYINFGFPKGVDSMTQDGKNFMVNLVYFAGKFNY